VKHPVVAPGLGLVESFTVTRWARAGGDRVGNGETVAMIETEKAGVEIEAPADGALEVVVPAGPDLVPADTILGYVVGRA
jgi:pyruvate/2-oxoglutarate dehydrogenase complex dihydrolipoamide acyltransferase (E2) component